MELFSKSADLVDSGVGDLILALIKSSRIFFDVRFFDSEAVPRTETSDGVPMDLEVILVGVLEKLPPRMFANDTSGDVNFLMSPWGDSKNLRDAIVIS